jgi:hypothetical protein
MSAFGVIEVSQIIILKTDEPKPGFNLLDADALAGKDLAQVDLASVEADACAGGDDDAFVVQRIIQLRQSFISHL